MTTGRIATSGRIPISGRISTASRSSSVSRQGFPFTLIGNGLQAFYRPDAGTVASSGGLVSSLEDLSGNGHTMVQATNARKPVWNLSGINNQPTIDFDGIDDGLTSATRIQNARDPWTQLIVFQASSLTGSRCLVLPTNGNGGHCLTINVSGTGKREIRSQGIGQSNDGNATLNPEVWVCTSTNASPTTSTLAMFTGIGQTPQTMTPAVLGNAAITGQGASLGCLTINFFFFAGKIAEYLFVDRVLSNSEITSYLSYVNSRYGAL